MKTKKEDLIQFIPLNYQLVKDDINIIETRIISLFSICGTLIVVITGLMAYMAAMKIDSDSMILFLSSIGFLMITFIYSIYILYPKTSSGRDITDESTDIKYTFFGEQGLPDTMSYGGFKKTWLDIDEIEMENFIKDQYLLDLWAKGILRSKKIKEFRVIFIPFALALITLSLGSILLVVDILN
jgi:Ca2+/Na+ antiporter